ncbi:butyrophilin subfamily 2 member A1-like [Heteronotia binoei]|uniref:butyrophilin subfamily 2 member A1-like n=1 Tax=Heteronotia binoei TaxID=13085 RepID=UPI00292FA226|nr:butyrophilin subfamily 2 member A1-like [Heteronotia binoei]
MCSLTTLVCLLMVLQTSYVVYSGQFAIIPPPSPVIGFLGEDVILPCQLTTFSVPESMKFTVHWTYDNSSEKSYVKSYDGSKKVETQDKRYQGRTELFHAELSKGNMSLNLKNSQLSDQGQYTCMVYLENWYDQAIIELNVMAKGEGPSISLELYEGHGIGLTCNSKGWYPNPHTLWLDSKRKNRTEKSVTMNTETPDGTFSISSSITIEPGADSEISCKIVSNVLQLESESRILISDAFYPTTSAWLLPFIIILLLILGIISFAVHKLKKSNQNVIQSENKKNTMKLEQEKLKGKIDSERLTRQAFIAELQERCGRLTVELDFRRARSYAAAVTLDSHFKHPVLTISEDQKTVFVKPSKTEQEIALSGNPVVVAKEAYAFGKHYWEVKVDDLMDWELGVMTEAQRDKNKTETFEKPLEKESWTLKSLGGDFFSNQNKIEKKEVPHSLIGIFLDQEEQNITFYNANLMFLIKSIPIQSTGKLYPFLSFGKAHEIGKEKSLQIAHIRVPTPFKNPLAKDINQSLLSEDAINSSREGTRSNKENKSLKKKKNELK